MTLNREQIEYWNGPRGAQWVVEQDLLDRTIAPFGAAILALAAPARGERVLDVGCGCGASVLALAEAVGPTGSVLGVDVSAPMLGRARERARDLPQAAFALDDAATHAFAPAAVDLLFSRFGVMFFVDPAAAFHNLAQAVAPGGRLAFVAWRGLAENHWMSVPFAAVKRVVPLAGPPPPADAPGPLAFADATRVRGILETAGFTDVAHAPFDHEVRLGDGSGLDMAVERALAIGPAARLFTTVTDDGVRAAARAAVRETLAPHLAHNDVTLPAAAWLVTARRA